MGQEAGVAGDLGCPQNRSFKRRDKTDPRLFGVTGSVLLRAGHEMRKSPCFQGLGRKWHASEQEIE
jgi:hypothetical protein